MVRISTFFFAGDPQNFIEDTTDMVSIPLVQQERGTGKRGGGGSMVITGVSASGGKKKGSSLPFNWGEEKTTAVRPLSSWIQKRDSTPILISLLNWLLCPLPVTRKYAEEANKKGAGGGKLDEKAFQERVTRLHQKEIEKGKKRVPKRKGGKAAEAGAEGGAWEACNFDRVEGAIQWFLGRLFGANAVSCLSSVAFSSKYFNNAILRQVLLLLFVFASFKPISHSYSSGFTLVPNLFSQVIRQVVLELPPNTTAHQFALFFSLPLSRY